MAMWWFVTITVQITSLYIPTHWLETKENKEEKIEMIFQEQEHLFSYGTTLFKR